MQKVLRVLNGRRAGAVFVLGQRAVIGRAGHVDIQLVHETVSRQHARLAVDEHGEVVLTDLSSDNGTFVNGESIARRVLRPGDTICVADTRFVYEHVAEDPSLRSSQVFAQRATSADSLRQTAPHRIVLPGGDERPRDPAAGQYLRQPDVGERRRDRVTPTHTHAPGHQGEAPARGPGRGRDRATPTRQEPREPAVPEAIITDRNDSASRGFATGAPSDAEDPTSPIELTPAWVEPPSPEAVQPRAMAPTRPEPRASQRVHATAEYAAGDTVAVPGGTPASRFDRAPPRHAFRRRATAEYGASWSDDTESDPFDTGESYGAEALVDVLAYRHLRLRSLRGDPLDARERARFATLERRLEHEPEHGDELALQRRFHRFACSLPLSIGVDPSMRGGSHPGRMLDLSAGGAQIRIQGAPVEAGDTVWLAMVLPGLSRMLPQAGASEGVVLESRVIWCSPSGDRIGVIFAGEAAFTAS
jgi:hypothetical protein